MKKWTIKLLLSKLAHAFKVLFSNVEVPTVNVWLLKLQIHCWWDDGVWWTKTLSEWDVTSVIINSLFSTLFSLSSPPNSSHSDQYPEPGKSSSQHFLPRWQIFSGQRSNTWLERDQPPFNIKINILNSPQFSTILDNYDGRDIIWPTFSKQSWNFCHLDCHE